MKDIVIGKHTLESLTSGMYSDPFVVFREYIQNATDSIDAAYKEKVLSKNGDRIEIGLNPAEKKIVIKDNGLGIPSTSAEKELVSIGNSSKNSANDRGFRGIGRLSALSYCSELTFETSYAGEPIKSKVSFNARELTRLLSEDDGVDTSASDVLSQICSFEVFPESSDQHYFIVTMDGVTESSGLNSYDEVSSYLSQNVPVPYSPDFTWGREIVKRLKNEGYYEKKYNVYLSLGNRTEPIYKPYHDTFIVDKGKNLQDSIKDISVFSIRSPDNELFIVGWTAKTSYLGSIYDKSIKGLRLRKGNILIGDNQTLNIIFKDARFNGWSVGELFAIDSKLIPNARRDDFEKNEAYFYMIEHLVQLASSITKDIRAASLKRNSELEDSARRTEQLLHEANVSVENGIHSTQKAKLKKKASDEIAALTKISVQDEGALYNRDLLFEDLDIIIGKIHGATEFKSINLLTGLSISEKKILEKIFKGIIAYDAEKSSALIDFLLQYYVNHGSNQESEACVNSPK